MQNFAHDFAVGVIFLGVCTFGVTALTVGFLYNPIRVLAKEVLQLRRDIQCVVSQIRDGWEVKK